MTSSRWRRLVLVASLSLAITLVIDARESGVATASTREACAKRPAFRRAATRAFDAWNLPETVARSSTADRAAGCWWMTAVRHFAPVPGVSVQQAASDLVAALGEQGYELERVRSEDATVWRARECRGQSRCDLTVTVADAASVEAEFLRRPARCHAAVVAFRLKAARVLDTWVLPDTVTRSSTPDRASADGCWWVQSVRSFDPAHGITATGAGLALAGALREQGYRVVHKDAHEDDGFPGYWEVSDCPRYPACEGALWIVDYAKHPHVEIELDR